MRYSHICMNGNWADRVETVLQHEGIDKELIISIKIEWDIQKNATWFSIFSRG